MYRKPCSLDIWVLWYIRKKLIYLHAEEIEIMHLYTPCIVQTMKFYNNIRTRMKIKLNERIRMAIDILPLLYRIKTPKLLNILITGVPLFQVVMKYWLYHLLRKLSLYYSFYFKAYNVRSLLFKMFRPIPTLKVFCE